MALEIKNIVEKNKASFAQSLITKLSKLEIIQVEKEDIGRMQFRFPSAPHSGKLSLTVLDASKSYDDLNVLEKINLEIVKGEKIAFVGKNGEGKTTLAKMIVGEVDFKGSIKLGHQVKMGYYSHNQADFLDNDLTILQTIEEAVTEHTTSNVRTILGSFLFSNDDVSKKISVLSGGERARVALCKLLLEPYNLLIMDEPTNELDFETILKRAKLVRNSENFCKNIQIINREAAEEKAQTQTQEDLLPEETLYEKFIPNKDTALFKTWHSSSWEDKLRLLDKFQDKRCSWFGQKIIYQEAPHILPPDLYKNIKSEIARRILSKNKEKWQTIGMAYTEIDTLRDQASNRDDQEELKKLDEINEFIMSIEKKYEIA